MARIAALPGTGSRARGEGEGHGKRRGDRRRRDPDGERVGDGGAVERPTQYLGVVGEGQRSPSASSTLAPNTLNSG
jgi:hypothetical protein